MIAVKKKSLKVLKAVKRRRNAARKFVATEIERVEIDGRDAWDASSKLIGVEGDVDDVGEAKERGGKSSREEIGVEIDDSELKHLCIDVWHRSGELV